MTNDKKLRQFLDLEAGESREESEEDLDPEEADFIDIDDDLTVADEELSRLSRQVHSAHANSPVRDQDSWWSALIERARFQARKDKLEVTATPEAEDVRSSLWRIPVKLGREEEIASILSQKTLPSDGWPFIRSILGRKSILRWIVIASDDLENVEKLCAGVADILGRPVQIPDEEAASWLNPQPYRPLPGSWVRVTDDSPYEGDLGWICLVTDKLAKLFVLPRFDRTHAFDQPRPGQKPGGKGLRCQTRPAQGLLTMVEARRLFGPEKLEQVNGENYYKIRDSQSKCWTILHGFLILETFNFEPTSPSNDELSLFLALDEFARLASHPECQEAWNMLASLRLQAGDRVRVVKGGLVGKSGVVSEVTGDQAASIALSEPDLAHVKVELPLLELLPLFQTGDYAKIMVGRYMGEHGFITGVNENIVTVYECKKLQSIEVEAHCVHFFTEPRIVARSADVHKVPQVPKLFTRNPQLDTLVGLHIRVIKDDVYKNYEGFIKRRLDHDETKVEVELSAKTPLHQASWVQIPLAHLAIWDDPFLTPLAGKSAKNLVPSATRIEIPVSSQPLLPSVPVPGMTVASRASTSATPAWSPSVAVASTPAWDPSSRTPGSSSTTHGFDASALFPHNPYITSITLPDSLRIKVVIEKSTGVRGWRGGEFEGSAAVWRKGDNKEAGIAHVNIDGRGSFSLPERFIRPYHPNQKGAVIVIDPQHAKYCQEFVIMSFKDHRTQCIVRAKGDNSRAKPMDNPNSSNRFIIPITSLAVIVE
ncbi:hypothetical protein H0H92_001642 [Tricholoma furcatifolium]|nr:hypothetical protein H0H92_001642 [Tricholoma furcatifolium]